MIHPTSQRAPARLAGDASCCWRTPVRLVGAHRRASERTPVRRTPFQKTCFCKARIKGLAPRGRKSPSSFRIFGANAPETCVSGAKTYLSTRRCAGFSGTRCQFAGVSRQDPTRPL